MSNDLVRFSRAGDEFHYQWAARRCLKLVHPKSNLKQIVIEGSLESKSPGEYIIDVSEYYNDGNIKYYQLKHTTVKKEIPFDLSDLKDTLKGFSERFISDKDSKSEFLLVTNRQINSNLKDFISNLINGKKYNVRYFRTLEKYTNLTRQEMIEFCRKLEFVDYEGDYAEQKFQLKKDLSGLIPGNIDTALIDNVKTLVQSKVFPDSDGIIYREDILKLFGVTSEYDLFPAPVEFEQIDRPILLKQTEIIKENLFNNYKPVIIHAAGGEGKTIFARELSEFTVTTDNYIAIIYDCFGGGRYRNVSEARHQHRIALPQIINELALKQLCEPLIVYRETSETDIVRLFRNKIKQAVASLREFDANQNLLLIVDAADNAEMVAIERNENGFIADLLKEDDIDGFKIIVTCRTERIHLLKPKSDIDLIKLTGFSENESFEHLLRKYAEATIIDGIEFHRLTNGNPRVQSYALMNSDNLEEVFNSLYNIGTTVNEQIQNQLRSAINKTKDKLTEEYQRQIDDICIGLATLPPFIPIEVLAKISNVEEATIASFASEVGKALWILDNAIQFRDEPTETWFRESFVAEKSRLDNFISKLLPITNQSVYVSSAMPQLLLKAEKYKELIDIALTDDYLPENALDKRNVKLYRLQFAFKASLKLNKFIDAIKISLLAGEETAGNKRQTELLKKNIDLIKPLLQEEYVQELAFKRLFSGDWNGSENIYTASLLSTEKKYLGESRNFLRSGTNWLHIHLEQSRKIRESDNRPHINKVTIEDITEYIFAYLNLYGVQEAIIELQKWRPRSLHFEVSNNIIKRLIDIESFDLIYHFASHACRNPYIIIAYVDQMSRLGKDVETSLLRDSLILLCSKKGRIRKKDFREYENNYHAALLTFLEICLKHNCSIKKISRVLNYYFDMKMDYRFNDYVYLDKQYRDILMRKFAMQQAVSEIDLNNIDILISEKYLGDNAYDKKNKIESIKSDFQILLPWYTFRLNVRINSTYFNLKSFEELYNNTQQKINNRYKDFDPIPCEIIKLIVQIVIASDIQNEDNISWIFNECVLNSKFINNNILFNLLGTSYRNEKLDCIKYHILEYVAEYVEIYKFESIDEKAEAYVNIARSICSKNPDDAAAYFNMAIEMVSKFGDEIVERWKSLVALAKRIGVTNEKNLPYRFIRCAEVVGENVYREKYWDRNEALLTCANLSLSTAIGALSRWRDRNIGEFDSLLFSLINEMVKINKIKPIYAWGLRSFINQYNIFSLGNSCINIEDDPHYKQQIFDELCDYLLINGLIDGENFKQLMFIVESEQVILNKKIFIQTTQHHVKNNIQDSIVVNELEIKWDELLLDHEFYSVEGIDKALSVQKSNDSVKYKNNEFWLFVIEQVANNKVNVFLESLIHANSTSIYDIGFVLSNLPREWTIKVSLKNSWGSLIKTIGSKYAIHFVNSYTVETFLRDLSINNKNKENLIEGVVEALSNHCILTDAEGFYSFINNITHLIDESDAIELLDYAIQRFEMHIDDDFSKGDLIYVEDAKDIMTIEKAMTGLIVSALGSPNSEVRWRATYAIKNLSDYELQNILGEILHLIESEHLKFYVDIRLPLYELHIKQYLLIAIQRISKDKPHLLLSYEGFLKRAFIEGPPHALIYRLLARIILNIENKLPNTFSEEVLSKAERQFESKEPIKKVNQSNIKKFINSFAFDNKFKPYHGYDMERYWFERLGRVFDLSENDVVNISNYSINKYFKEYYIKDERQNFGIYNYEETHHSHGSYPKVDTYSFYMSYHSMFMAASMMFDNLSVVQNDWYEDSWESWIEDHILTLNDSWISERRDEIPILQNNWEYDEKTDWLNGITQNDFLEQTINEHNNQKSIIVRGFWENKNKDQIFHVNIYSALVSKDSSEALLNALNACEDPYDFKLPDYKEDMEINFESFKLIGWLENDSKELKLDKNDPFSNNVPYPNVQIGELFKNQLKIQYDDDFREGISLLNPKAIIKNEIWSKEGSEIKGNRMKVSLDFIELIINKLNFNLLIEVQIRKSRNTGYLYGGSDKFEYSKPKSRLFLFTGIDGCRDSENYYKFREEDS